MVPPPSPSLRPEHAKAEMMAKAEGTQKSSKICKTFSVATATYYLTLKAIEMFREFMPGRRAAMSICPLHELVSPAILWNPNQQQK